MLLDSILPYSAIVAIAGGAMVTGLLFAFSNCVMQALAELPSEYGIRAMQEINKKILNPIFFIAFFGTPLACLLVAVLTLSDAYQFHALLLLLGAISYLIGPLGVTLKCNVPLNNTLEALKPSDGEEFWARYLADWQRWNHIRTFIGLVSIVLLSAGLAYLP